MSLEDLSIYTQSTSRVQIKEPDSNVESDLQVSSHAYQMRPRLPQTFKSNKIKKRISKILVKRLKGKNYEDAKFLTKQISEDVNHAVRKLKIRNYKHVVQVVIGQELGAGFHFSAKCKWDVECDSYASDVYTNSTLFCVCTVFGIYLY